MGELPISTTVVDGGTGEPYRFLDTLSFVALSGSETDGRFSVVEMRLREGHCPPMHVHENADELVQVTEGRLTVFDEEGSQEATTGELVVLPRGEAHSLLATEPTTIVTLTQPAGFGAFVADVGEPAEERLVPDTPPSDAAIESVQRKAADHGIEIVGPPPADREP